MNSEPNLTLLPYAIPINYFLAVLDNCDSDKRYKKWKRDGGTLLGRTDKGCGINSLTFLGVLPRNIGEQLIPHVEQNGTTFVDMIKYVQQYNDTQNKEDNTTFIEIFFEIETNDKIVRFLNNLQYFMLPENSCTIAKLTRNIDKTKRAHNSCINLTAGHSVIFSKEKGNLYTIDPHLMQNRARADLKIFESWNYNCYETVSLIFKTNVFNNRFLFTHNVNKIRSNSKIIDSVPMNIDSKTIYYNDDVVPMDISPIYNNDSIKQQIVSMDISPNLMKKNKSQKNTRR
jgi:hypothetical protein